MRKQSKLVDPPIVVVPIITKDVVEKGIRLSSELSQTEEIINNRINYIMQFIFKLFKCEDAYWCFSDYESEDGSLWDHYDPESINASICDTNGNELVITLSDGSDWGLDDGIPTRWLFESFEQELIAGKKTYEVKEELAVAAKKIAEADAKLKDQILANKAKEKLSKEELDAIKRHLL